MKLRGLTSFIVVLIATTSITEATTIGEINGNRYLSPFKDQTVSHVEGLVLAKGPSGFWMRSPKPSGDPAVSDAIYVYIRGGAGGPSVGDIVTLSATVKEYRSQPSHIYLTELTDATNIRVVSSNNKVTPKVIGVDTLSPPTEEYTSLDGGDIYGIPNNVYQISNANPVLEPTKYGLDFWESLSGELVTIKAPRGLARPNFYGNTWVVGDWKQTGENKHGGLTMTTNDSNPEAIIIGKPLDRSRNPMNTKMGDQFADITGVVQYVFGFYTVVPLTALKVIHSAESPYPTTTLVSEKSCSGLTIGSYNVENLNPVSPHLDKVAYQIANNLRSPDIVFIQEVQDDSGPRDNGVVSANRTLSTLAKAIKGAGGAEYHWIQINPENNKDGGQPGGNIRNAYLYRPEMVELHNLNPGGSTDANEVFKDKNGYPALKYNPGRIAPRDEAWQSTRKPLVAAWTVKNGGTDAPFFTVNVHLSSKRGSSPLHGDERPPVNGAVVRRSQQAALVGSFVKSILDIDSEASVVVAGDYNEFSWVGPLKNMADISGLVDLDAAADIPPEERYSYTFDMNSQLLDHFFVSPVLADAAGVNKPDTGATQFEHIHLSAWQNKAGEVSDHDPAVAKFSPSTTRLSATPEPEPEDGEFDNSPPRPRTRYISSPLASQFPRVDREYTGPFYSPPFSSKNLYAMSASAAMRATESWVRGEPLDDVMFALAVLEKGLELRYHNCETRRVDQRSHGLLVPKRFSVWWSETEGIIEQAYALGVAAVPSSGSPSFTPPSYDTVWATVRSLFNAWYWVGRDLETRKSRIQAICTLRHRRHSRTSGGATCDTLATAPGGQRSVCRTTAVAPKPWLPSDRAGRSPQLPRSNDAPPIPPPRIQGPQAATGPLAT